MIKQRIKQGIYSVSIHKSSIKSSEAIEKDGILLHECKFSSAVATANYKNIHLKFVSKVIIYSANKLRAQFFFSYLISINFFSQSILGMTARNSRWKFANIFSVL